MKRISILFLVPLTAAIIVASCFRQATPISEKSLLEYASSSYDKRAYGERHQVLGELNGTEVVVDFVCSDLCPDYTVRIIHFSFEPGDQCAAVGGVEKTIIVPVAITARAKVFCVPKVIADHWDSYVR